MAIRHYFMIKHEKLLVSISIMCALFFLWRKVLKEKGNFFSQDLSRQISFKFFIFTKMKEIWTSLNQDVTFLHHEFYERPPAYEKNYCYFLSCSE